MEKARLKESLTFYRNSPGLKSKGIAEIKTMCMYIYFQRPIVGQPVHVHQVSEKAIIRFQKQARRILRETVTICTLKSAVAKNSCTHRMLGKVDSADFAGWADCADQADSRPSHPNQSTPSFERTIDLAESNHLQGWISKKNLHLDGLVFIHLAVTWCQDLCWYKDTVGIVPRQKEKRKGRGKCDSKTF